MITCATCDEPIQQQWNIDYCGPTCVIIGLLSLDIEAHNLGLGGIA